MSLISDAKQAFNHSIETELDEIGGGIRDLATRAREAAKDARGLNDLGTSFAQIANTLEIAASQVEDTRNEARTWLGTNREPIHERTNLSLLTGVPGAQPAKEAAEA